MDRTAPFDARLAPRRPMSKDLLSGLILTIAGAALLVQAFDLEAGSATSMGAGYLPRVAAAVLLAIGLGFLASSLRNKRESVGPLGWRALILVAAAIGAFALVMPRFGLIAGAVALVVLTSLAGREFRLGEVVVLAAGLCLLAVTLFVYLLGLPMKV
jgi:Tripartite tricarboxylate transporter TctB family